MLTSPFLLVCSVLARIGLVAAQTPASGRLTYVCPSSGELLLMTDGDTRAQRLIASQMNLADRTAQDKM